MATFDTMPGQTSDTDVVDDGLYDKRKRVLGRLKVSVFILLVISLAWVVVGVVTTVKARPDNHIPYMIGGGCIGGGMSIFYVLIVLGMVKAGRATPKGKNSTSSGFKCLTRCHFVMAGFLWVALLIGFGIAGMWGFIECATRTEKDDNADFSLNFCEPDKDTLYLLSLASFILGAVSILIVMLTHCFFCCNMKAFGMRHYQGWRGAYIDYSAGEERPPVTLHDVPASQPLYIRTEHGFQEVQPSRTTGPTPSAPPIPQIDIQYERDYDHDRDRNRDREDDDHKGTRGRGHRGRGHRGRGRGRGPRDRSPDNHRERPPRDRPPGDRSPRPRDRPPGDRSPRGRDRPPGDRSPRGRGRRRGDRERPDRRYEGDRHSDSNTEDRLGPGLDDNTRGRDDDSHTKQKEEPPPSYTEVMNKGDTDLKIDIV